MEIALKGDHDTSEWNEVYGRGLSIGYAKEFDQSAAVLQWQYVQIEGRVNDMCRPWLGGGGCTDRAPDIEPTSIKAAQAPKDSQ